MVEYLSVFSLSLYIDVTPTDFSKRPLLFFIYLNGICSCDALLTVLVAQNDEGPTIFVERERSGKGAHCFRVWRNTIFNNIIK